MGSPLWTARKERRDKMLFHKCKCGAMIPQGVSMCGRCEKNEKEESRHVLYNRHRRNKQAAAFYVSAEWRKVRQKVISDYDGLDLYALYVCKEIRMADMVHHIEPLEEDWNRRLDPDNLIPLSSRSHGIIEAMYKRDSVTRKNTKKLLKNLKKQYDLDGGGVQKSF